MARKPRNRPTGETEAIAERRIRAFELRKAGYSLREIGHRLEVSHMTIKEDIDTVLAELTEKQQAKAEQYRAIELERLDVMVRSIWPFVMAGSAGAIDTALKISTRRSKLLGLDAPPKPQLNLTKDVTQMTDEELEAELKRHGLA
jgi:hypothetical protein